MKTILYRLDNFVELNETKTNLLFHLDLAEVSPKLQAKLFSFFFYGQHSSKISELVDFVG